MPVPATEAPWVGSFCWLVAIAVAAFLVSWVVATVLAVGRNTYIAVLTVVTAALFVGYVGWLGVGWSDVLTTNWLWGIIVGPLCGAFLVVGMRKQPVVERRTGRRLAAALGWQAVVYGVAEGMLLSVLPVLAAWEMLHSLGWTGAGGDIARWTLPIVASVVVIVVHHLGYPEYRNRMLIPISAGCGLLSVGYLVTASPIAPTLGHVLGHTSGLLHGAALPPHTGDGTAHAKIVAAARSSHRRHLAGSR